MLWRERLATFAFLVMEGCWLAAAAVAVGAVFGTEGAPLGVGSVLVAALGAYYINRGLQQLPVALNVLRLASLLCAVAFLFVLLQAQYGSAKLPLDPGWLGGLVEQASGAGGLGRVKGVLVGAAFLLGVWLRGTRLAAGSDQSEALSTSFRVGMAVLGMVALGQAAFAQEVSVAGLVFPFFGFGLVGMALNQLAARERGLGSLPRGYWLTVAGGTVGLLLVAGLLLGLAAGVESTRALGRAMGAVGEAVSRVLDMLILGIAWLVGWVYQALELFFNWLRALLGAQQQSEPQPVATPQVNQTPPSIIPDSVLAGIKWGLVALAVAVVVLVVFFAFMRRRHEGQPQGPAFRESLQERGQLRADLLRALGDLAGRLRRPRGVARLQWGDSPREQVLRSYAGFLDLAAGQGLERQATVTALEFLPLSRSLFPQPEGQRLTEAFLKARYGGWEPSAADASAIQGDLEILRLALAARA